MACRGVRTAAGLCGGCLIAVMALVPMSAGKARVGDASADARVAARALAPVRFAFTGGEQTYEVPDGVASLQVQAVGADGEDAVPAGAPGQPDVSGGRGGMVGGKLAVGAGLAIEPGDTLYVVVGESPSEQADGVFNGGGAGGGLAGNGGGATDLRTCSMNAASCINGVPSLLTRLIVAGGGGGTGDCDPDNVSNCALTAGSGGSAGQAGFAPGGVSSQGGGSPGTLSGPGAAGGTGGDVPATSGGLDGTGGDGGGYIEVPTAGGGGGGGGYFGGGGGDLVPVDVDPYDGGAGGGGGANFASPFAVTGASFTLGDGTPRLVITPQPKSAVQVTRIVYNPPGRDSGTNASLNAETIQLTNTGPTARQLSGWRIADADGNVYRFDPLSLRPGASVTIHSGRGHDTSRHRYWNRRRYVWDNARDLARVYRANGKLASQCRHENRAASRIRC